MGTFGRPLLVLVLGSLVAGTAVAQPPEGGPGPVTPPDGGAAPAQPATPPEGGPGPETGPATPGPATPGPATPGPADQTPQQPAPGPGQASPSGGEPAGPEAPAGEEDEDERLPPVLISLTGYLGFPRETGFDDVLVTFGYGPSPRVWGGDLSVLPRILPWLHVGGRAAFRFRHWARANRPAAMAWAPELLAVVDARWTLKHIGLGAALAAGVAMAGVRINDRAELSVAPRVQGAVSIDFPLIGQLGGYVRLAIDYFRVQDADAEGHSVDLGGVHVAVGVEVGRDRS